MNNPQTIGEIIIPKLMTMLIVPIAAPCPTSRPVIATRAYMAGNDMPPPIPISKAKMRYDE
ncbi:MAG: hypothetical protein PHD71_08765, partial [Methanospirillum sp.]|nr:hypothetical protein [Methanospirillum sp.]